MLISKCKSETFKRRPSLHCFVFWMVVSSENKSCIRLSESVNERILNTVKILILKVASQLSSITSYFLECIIESSGADRCTTDDGTINNLLSFVGKQLFPSMNDKTHRRRKIDHAFLNQSKVKSWCSERNIAIILVWCFSRNILTYTHSELRQKYFAYRLLLFQLSTSFYRVYENWSKDKLVAILKNKYRPHSHPHLHPHAHPHPHPHSGTWKETTFLSNMRSNRHCDQFAFDQFSLSPFYHVTCSCVLIVVCCSRIYSQC